MPGEVGRYRPGRQVWSAVPSGDRLFTLDGASSVRLLRPERLARQPAAPAGGVLRFENRPNPFRDRTVIQFRLASGQATALSVYNIQGQLVRTLAAGVFPAGDHRVPWDGRSTRGHPLASGVYLCRLHTGDRDLCHTIVLLR
ncbi:T9SS type A sorting domain-containing protein [bacterium]|nr:T9SS type A sorting domain-containing protein [bacterium]